MYCQGPPYDSHSFIILSNNKKALQLLMVGLEAYPLKETVPQSPSFHDKGSFCTTFLKVLYLNSYCHCRTYYLGYSVYNNHIAAYIFHSEVCVPN